VQNVLTEIAGLLVVMRVFTIILGVFHEKRFISKMQKETKESSGRCLHMRISKGKLSRYRS
jgi:hypothetical protein